MKYVDLVFLVVLVVLCLVIGAPADAAECFVPANCEIISSEFSTGGGENSYAMEVDCKQPDGLIVKYVNWKVTPGGLLGFGRVTAPRKIVFLKHAADSLDCEY